MLAAQVLDRNPSLVFLQYPNNLLFAKSVPFHLSGPFLLGPELTSMWIAMRGQGHQIFSIKFCKLKQRSFVA